jgi:hypothetical protein
VIGHRRRRAHATGTSPGWHGEEFPTIVREDARSFAPGINATETSLAAVRVALVRAQCADSFRHAGQPAQHLPYVSLDLGRKIRPAGGKIERNLDGPHQAVDVLLGRKLQFQLDQNGAANRFDQRTSGGNRVLRIVGPSVQRAGDIALDGIEIQERRLFDDGDNRPPAV